SDVCSSDLPLPDPFDLSPAPDDPANFQKMIANTANTARPNPAPTIEAVIVSVVEMTVSRVLANHEPNQPPDAPPTPKPPSRAHQHAHLELCGVINWIGIESTNRIAPIASIDCGMRNDHDMTVDLLR